MGLIFIISYLFIVIAVVTITLVVFLVVSAFNILINGDMGSSYLTIDVFKILGSISSFFDKNVSGRAITGPIGPDTPDNWELMLLCMQLDLGLAESAGDFLKQMTNRAYTMGKPLAESNSSENLDLCIKLGVIPEVFRDFFTNESGESLEKGLEFSYHFYRPLSEGLGIYVPKRLIENFSRPSCDIVIRFFTGYSYGEYQFFVQEAVWRSFINDMHSLILSYGVNKRTPIRCHLRILYRSLMFFYSYNDTVNSLFNANMILLNKRAVDYCLYFPKVVDIMSYYVGPHKSNIAKGYHEVFPNPIMTITQYPNKDNLRDSFIKLDALGKLTYEEAYCKKAHLARSSDGTGLVISETARPWDENFPECVFSDAESLAYYRFNLDYKAMFNHLKENSISFEKKDLKTFCEEVKNKRLSYAEELRKRDSIVNSAHSDIIAEVSKENSEYIDNYRDILLKNDNWDY